MCLRKQWRSMYLAVFDTNFPAKLPFGQPGLYFLLPSVFFLVAQKIAGSLRSPFIVHLQTLQDILFLSASKPSHGKSVSHVVWYFLTRLPSSLLSGFSVDISSGFFSSAFLTSSTSSTSLPFPLSSSLSSFFRFFLENPNWNRLISTTWSLWKSRENTKRKFGRVEPGYGESTNILCGLKKHGGHDFVHSVSCSFRCILFKLICIFFQSTANGYENTHINTINKLTAKSFQFALFPAGHTVDRSKTSACPIGQLLP